MFGCIGSSLRQAGSFLAVHGLSSCGMWARLLPEMWDLSSQTRDGTHVPAVTRESVNHWTTRDVRLIYFPNEDLLVILE